MKITPRLWHIMISLLVLISIIGYIQFIQLDKNQENPIRVGITVYDGNDLFISDAVQYIEDYIIQVKEELQLDIQVSIMDAEHNQTLQNRQINQWINEAYDVVIVNAVQREDASMIIDQLKKAQIPAIFFNREPVPADMRKWNELYYVGSSAIQAGDMQGELLANAIKEGKVQDKNKDNKIQYVMLEGEYGHQDAILRTYHCIDRVEEHGYDMENIAIDTASWRKDKAKTIVKEWLETYGNQIEVILSNNDAMALGAIGAMEELGYKLEENWIPVFGVDGIEEALKAIDANKMLGTVLNDSEEQAKCIVFKLVEIITGNTYENKIATPQVNNYFWVEHKMIKN